MFNKADIHDVETIQTMGAVAVFVAVEQAGCNPSLNLLDALSAGLQDRHIFDLSVREKGELRRELEDYREHVKGY